MFPVLNPSRSGAPIYPENTQHMIANGVDDTFAFPSDTTEESRFGVNINGKPTTEFQIKKTNNDGASVNYSAVLFQPPAKGATITTYSQETVGRLSSFSNNTVLDAKSLNKELNHIHTLIVQLHRQVDNCVQFPLGNRGKGFIPPKNEGSPSLLGASLLGVESNGDVGIFSASDLSLSDATLPETSDDTTNIYTALFFEQTKKTGLINGDNKRKINLLDYSDISDVNINQSTNSISLPPGSYIIYFGATVYRAEHHTSVLVLKNAQGTTKRKFYGTLSSQIPLNNDNAVSTLSPGMCILRIQEPGSVALHSLVQGTNAQSTPYDGSGSGALSSLRNTNTGYVHFNQIRKA